MDINLSDHERKEINIADILDVCISPHDHPYNSVD